MRRKTLQDNVNHGVDYHVYVVTGPPGAGKTTYVHQHAQPGDVIVDFDRISKALRINDTEPSQHVQDAAFKAWVSTVDYLLDPKDTARQHNSYIIHSMPNDRMIHKYRKAKAQVSQLNPGRETCIARVVERDSDPTHALRYIRKWFDEFAGDHEKLADETSWVSASW